jgi:hypothetical protein
MKTALILVIPVVFTNCRKENKTPENKLDKIISYLNDKSSISYTCITEFNIFTILTQQIFLSKQLL